MDMNMHIHFIHQYLLELLTSMGVYGAVNLFICNLVDFNSLVRKIAYHNLFYSVGYPVE